MLIGVANSAPPPPFTVLADRRSVTLLAKVLLAIVQAERRSAAVWAQYLPPFVRAVRRSVTLPAHRLQLSMRVAARDSAAVPAFCSHTIVLADPSSATDSAPVPWAIVDAERRSAAVFALGRLLIVLATSVTATGRHTPQRQFS